MKPCLEDLDITIVTNGAPGRVIIKVLQSKEAVGMTRREEEETTKKKLITEMGKSGRREARTLQINMVESRDVLIVIRSIIGFRIVLI